ncbi:MULTISPECIES: ABC transporter ATP-binding protein [Paenibacillus]|uniref:ABC transporter ATP-binding protein n=1 Tax=Paenibacillus TaxID=44249 RepID=UPI0008833595|nr:MULTISPECIES: ABC transporter ATP-binding protein [unclassified Paenibacillus]GCL74072.1 ABC transporter ATP-binding protein [Paenibacillus naphthalenovorans]SDJ33729.1 NitT/TauT family transport system ATP-binding protein [Paenibacillus naphthalenovorans]
MGAGVLVEVSEVSKAYKAAGKNEQILSGISLQVKEGEIISILGQSGCGKSTLLNLIAGFDTPDRGTIYTAGIEVKEPAKRCVMLFQNYGLLPWRSVLKNVELGLLDLTEAERRSRALAYLKLVGLEDRADHFPHQLSGGMQQRAALARALAIRPQIILMDEPFAALDTFTRYYLQNELLNIHANEKTTILLVTHDIDEAVFLSDRILIMSAGPGQIRKEIPIHSSRPRDRGHSDFQHYRKLILDEFRLTGPQANEEYSI